MSELFRCVLSQWPLLAGLGVLAVAFSGTLLDLIRYGQREDLYSHAVLIPFITAYLVWIQRNELAAPKWQLTRASLMAGVLGAGALIGYFAAAAQGWQPSRNDRLSVLMLSFVSFAFALCHAAGGRDNARQLAFPLGFLIFMVPMPLFVAQGFTVFLQVTSAHVSYWMIKLTGTPIFREGLVFAMPGLEVEVAEECSGIRSTYVLLITSLLAGYLFLRRPWGKWCLAAAVIPIGILRNGLRILTISWLTVHIDPGVISGPIHKRGGPFFFLISLVPLFLLLLKLRKSEKALATVKPAERNDLVVQ